MENENCLNYLDFAFQHYAKSLFDQGKYTQALNHFNKELIIRKQNTNLELINSTNFAIKKTRKFIHMKPIE